VNPPIPIRTTRIRSRSPRPLRPISTSCRTDFKNPQAENYSVGVTQKINAELSIHIDGVYVHSRGDRIKYDLNLPNPYRDQAAAQYVSSIRIGQSSSRTTRRRSSDSDKRLSHRYTFLVSYTLGQGRTPCQPRDQQTAASFHVTDQSNHPSTRARPIRIAATASSRAARQSFPGT